MLKLISHFPRETTLSGKVNFSDHFIKDSLTCNMLESYCIVPKVYLDVSHNVPRENVFIGSRGMLGMLLLLHICLEIPLLLLLIS